MCVYAHRSNMSVPRILTEVGNTRNYVRYTRIFVAAASNYLENYNIIV